MNRRKFVKNASMIGVSFASSFVHATAGGSQTDAICGLSASQLSRAIRERSISCEETMLAYLERIHRYNSFYNAIVSMVDDSELLRQAGLADKALMKGEYWGWMHGMPHAVKDLADAHGLKTSFGSPLFTDNTARKDSLHISRIRSQGAIFIGKTNTPEFGLGSQTYNTVFGTTRNVYKPDLIAGGSSGGAAVALAAQLIPTADGSDMMGSLRNPAAFNNVVGFRPSQGRVPSPSADSNLFYDQLSTNGPMGRTVEDTIQLLATMAGYDSRAPLSMRDDIPKFSEFVPLNLEKVRIGWMGSYEGYLAMEPGVQSLCERALKQVTSHGALVESCKPDFEISKLWEAWLTLRHWSWIGGKSLYDNPDTRELLKPELQWEIEGSFNVSAQRIADAGRIRSDWYRAIHKLFDRYDVLALPSAQVFPFSISTHWPKQIDGRAMDTYHRWMEVVIGGTLGGFPVVSLPAGFDVEGRPMGIQFMGPMGHDLEVLQFALAYESATNYLDQRPVLKTRL